MPLPTDPKERKNAPVFSGVLAYFPDALVEVAKQSKLGNDQHHPGEPLFWDRTKSTDELDALVRHLLDAALKQYAGNDTIEELRAVAWRALAALQKACEKRDEAKKPLLQRDTQPGSLSGCRLGNPPGPPNVIDLENMWIGKP